MSRANTTARQFLIAAVTAVLELVIFFWFGLATTSLEMLNRELYYTSIYLLPALGLRFAIYQKIWTLSSSSLKLRRLKSWLLFTTPVWIWFIYRMLEPQLRGEKLGDAFVFFAAYLVLEILVCYLYVSLTFSTSLAARNQGPED